MAFQAKHTYDYAAMPLCSQLRVGYKWQRAAAHPTRQPSWKGTRRSGCLPAHLLARGRGRETRHDPFAPPRPGLSICSNPLKPWGWEIFPSLPPGKEPASREGEEVEQRCHTRASARRLQERNGAAREHGIPHGREAPRGAARGGPGGGGDGSPLCRSAELKSRGQPSAGREGKKKIIIKKKFRSLQAPFPTDLIILQHFVVWRLFRSPGTE